MAEPQTILRKTFEAESANEGERQRQGWQAIVKRVGGRFRASVAPSYALSSRRENARTGHANRLRIKKVGQLMNCLGAWFRRILHSLLGKHAIKWPKDAINVLDKTTLDRAFNPWPKIVKFESECRISSDIRNRGVCNENQPSFPHCRDGWRDWSRQLNRPKS